MEDLYNKVSAKPHDPTSPWQHEDEATEMACRVLEELAKQGADSIVFRAYNHLMGVNG